MAKGSSARIGAAFLLGWVLTFDSSAQTGPAVPIGGGGTPGEGGIPSAPEGGPREAPARVTLQNATAARVTVTPHVAGTAHVILAVEDNGSPALTSYRRVILTIKAK